MTNKELHLKYIIFFLVLTIVGLIVLRYYDVPDLVDKLTFSLTLSSLLLSLLAIFYTISTSHKQDTQLNKLTETHTELQSSAREIRNVSSSIDSVISKVPKDYKNLQRSLDLLKEKFDNIKLPESVIKEKNITDNDLNFKFELNEKLFYVICYEIGFRGILVLYLFSRGFKVNKMLNWSGFSDNNFPYDYFIGVIDVFKSLGLVKYESDFFDITPTFCNIIILEKVENVLETYLYENQKYTDLFKKLFDNVINKFFEDNT